MDSCCSNRICVGIAALVSVRSPALHGWRGQVAKRQERPSSTPPLRTSSSSQKDE